MANVPSALSCVRPLALLLFVGVLAGARSVQYVVRSGGFQIAHHVSMPSLLSSNWDDTSNDSDNLEDRRDPPPSLPSREAQEPLPPFPRGAASSSAESALPSFVRGSVGSVPSSLHCSEGDAANGYSF